MAPWKGRSKMRVYIRDKPHPNGLKIYILADEKGYVYDFWIYRGNQPKTKDIVLNFAVRLPGEGYILTFDAYYGGWELALELDAHRLYFIASCTATRPSSIFAKRLHKEMQEHEARGSWAWLSYRRSILAVSWRDQKILNLLTNLVDKPRKAYTRKVKGERVKVPQIVEEYRTTLNFVDRANAYRLRYPFRHRTVKNTRVQWWTILMMAVVNSWILMSYVNEERISYRKFLIDLVEQLEKYAGSRRQCSRTRAPPPKHTVHLPIPAKTRGTCKLCGVVGSCTTVCSVCRDERGQPVHLHHGKKTCFARFHGVGL